MLHREGLPPRLALYSALHICTSLLLPRTASIDPLTPVQEEEEEVKRENMWAFE